MIVLNTHPETEDVVGLASARPWVRSLSLQ